MAVSMREMAVAQAKRSAVRAIFSALFTPIRWAAYILAGVVTIFIDGPRYSNAPGHRTRTSRAESQMFTGSLMWCFIPSILQHFNAPAFVVVLAALTAPVLVGLRLRYADPQVTTRLTIPAFWQKPGLLVPALLAFVIALLPVIPATRSLLADFVPLTWWIPPAAIALAGVLYWVALLVSARHAGRGRARASEVAAMLRVACGVSDQEVAESLKFKAGSWTLSPAPAIAMARLASDPAGVDAAVAAVMPRYEITLSGRDLVVQEASLETVARREALASSGGMIVAITPDPDDSDRKILTLAPTVSPTAGPRVEAWARGQGLDLVSWRPFEHQAIATAALSDDERAHRQRYADSLKSDPFDVDVQISTTSEGKRVISIRSQALTRLGGSARDAYVDDLIAITPGATDVWLVDVDAVSGAITIREREDPLGGVFSYPKDALVTHKRVPIGVAEDGRAMAISLIESNLLVAGIPGSGKSGTSTCLLAGISRLPHVALVGLDPKKVELSPWKPRFSVIARDTDFHHANAVLEALIAEMNRRYDWLEQHGLKKVTPELLSDEFPLLVVVIDELADLVSMGATPEEKKGDVARSSMIRRLIAKGRASGISVITLTQKPSSDVIPTSLRDLIAQRVAHSTSTPEMTETVLAAGSRETAPAQKIPASAKGVGYLLPEEAKLATRFKAYWVPDEDVAGLAAQTAHLRVEVPWLPTEASAIGMEPDTFGQIIETHTPAPLQGTDFGEIDFEFDEHMEVETAHPGELPPVHAVEPAPTTYDTPAQAPRLEQPPVITSTRTKPNFDDLFG